MVFYVQVLNEANMHSRILKLQGLDSKLVYSVKELDMNVADAKDIVKDMDRSFSGELLMNAGLNFERMWGDYRAKVVVLEA